MLRIPAFQAVLLACLSLSVYDATAEKTVTPDDEIKQLVIEASISTYSGSCACPYNRARNGSLCGKRSAWSKPGGAQPFCYKEEVSEEQVQAWRREHGE